MECVGSPRGGLGTGHPIAQRELNYEQNSYRMRVALLYNPRPAAYPTAASPRTHPPRPTPEAAFEEYDSPATIAAILGALRGLGLYLHPVVAARYPTRR